MPRQLRPLPAEPDRLRADASGRPVGVDREKKVILGYVMAEVGPFKTPGRGEFDHDSLREIVRLANANPKGLRSRFQHPNECDDGLGKYLGRVRNARMDGDRARGDLHLSPSSFNTPAGDLGTYVLDLADEDSDALSSSLVLRVEQEFRIDAKGRRLTDPKTNEPLPPLWRPKMLYATDVVDTGDAVNGLLSVDNLPDGMLWRAAELLDRLGPDTPREVLEARAQEWFGKYLDRRYGGEKAPPLAPVPPHAGGAVPAPQIPTPQLDSRRVLLAEIASFARKYRR